MNVCWTLANSQETDPEGMAGEKINIWEDLITGSLSPGDPPGRKHVCFREATATRPKQVPCAEEAYLWKLDWRGKLKIFSGEMDS